MDINNNTIRLVRALVKLSSALYDIDELKDDKRYKFALKKDLDIWHEWIEEYIKLPISSFTKADPDTLMSLITMFDDFEKQIEIVDEFTTRINLFLAKTESALHDIDTLEPPYQEYMNILKIKIEKLLKQNYFNPYINYVDPEGHGYKSIVNSLNQVGETIIVGTT
jgi:hypothetical protein